MFVPIVSETMSTISSQCAKCTGIITISILSYFTVFAYDERPGQDIQIYMDKQYSATVWEGTLVALLLARGIERLGDFDKNNYEVA
jgi:hypothetical protein